MLTLSITRSISEIHPFSFFEIKLPLKEKIKETAVTYFNNLSIIFKNIRSNISKINCFSKKTFINLTTLLSLLDYFPLPQLLELLK